jgi:hypothetical protein
MRKHKCVRCQLTASFDEVVEAGCVEISGQQNEWNAIEHYANYGGHRIWRHSPPTAGQGTHSTEGEIGRGVQNLEAERFCADMFRDVISEFRTKRGAVHLVSSPPRRLQVTPELTPNLARLPGGIGVHAKLIDDDVWVQKQPDEASAVV